SGQFAGRGMVRWQRPAIRLHKAGAFGKHDEVGVCQEWILPWVLCIPPWHLYQEVAGREFL
ncbi:hypothetical protein ABTQ08_20780, partial [Acinetobacter baumannii]